MIRRALAVLAAAALLVVAAPVAGAKEGVEARLTTAVPLDASPGRKIAVAWTLSYVENGRRRPFGAAEIYVRLLSASGGEPGTAFASRSAHADGRYTARVTVPDGGLAGIEIGIRGHGDGGPSDFAFPIANDPFTARASAASDSAAVYRAPESAPAPAARESYDRTALIAALALVSVIGLALSGALDLRRTSRFGART